MITNNNIDNNIDKYYY